MCCLTHKIIHNPDNLPQAITELFTLNKQVHDYNTRKNEGLHKYSNLWIKENKPQSQ